MNAPDTPEKPSGLADFMADAQRKDIIFFYSGFFSQSVVAAIGEALRSKLEAAGASGLTARKVFSSYIEMAQNILHYAHVDANHPSAGHGAIAIATQGENFALVCVNSIPTDAVERLKARLAHINGLSREEIRAAYREQLRNEPEAGSKGAGLGLLTLARDAAEPIAYEFAADPDHPAHAMFFLRSII